MKLKNIYETSYIVIFLSLMFFIGPGSIFNHEIAHDFPYGYMASDTFQHQVRVESIKQMGNYRYEASYISAGCEDCVGFYMPLIYHVGVLFSNSAGLETYDGLYFLIFFFGILATILMYFILRKFNQNIAILSVPIMSLIFSSGSFIGFTWGGWPSIIGQFFLIGTFWAIMNIDLKYSYILIAIMITGIVMTHTSELLMVVLFIITYMIIDFTRGKKIDIKKVKTFSYAAIISFIASLYYLIIFKGTWMVVQPFSLSIQTTLDAPTFLFPDFKILMFIIGVGFIISLFFIKKMFFPVLIGISMLIMGYGNYWGIARHAFKIRYFWPIYLSFFVGIFFYFLISKIKKNKEYFYVAGLIIIILLNFITIPYFPRTQAVNSSGIMNPYHWDMFKWMRANTEKDARVLYFYGDIYGQNALLRNAFSPPHMVRNEWYFEAIQEGVIKREYPIAHLGDHHGAYYPYRSSLFSFDFRAEERGGDILTSSTDDICTYDYYVIDKYVSVPAIANYNILLAQLLTSNDWIDVVYSNDMVVVLKNNDITKDCIPIGGIDLNERQTD